MSWEIIIDKLRREEEERRDLENESSRRLHKEMILPTDFSNPHGCAHDDCNECHGSMMKNDGSKCVHMISCPCPRCSPGTF